MEKILVLDFGGQYNQLIARRVRDHHVYAEILPYTTDIEIIKQNYFKGIIFTGGPNSVYDMASTLYTKDTVKSNSLKKIQSFLKMMMKNRLFG